MEPFIAYLLVGIVIVLLGLIGIGRGSKKKKRCTASATAVIAEIEKDTDDSDGNGTHKKYSYTPIYEFTVNGNTVRKSGGIYSRDKKKFHIGDLSAVMYNPDDPEEFIVKGNNGGRAFGIVLLLFGAVIIAVAFTQR